MDAEIALRNKLIKVSFVFVIALFSLMLFFLFIALIPYASRAASNVLTLKIKMQGVRKTNDQIKAHIDFYNGPEKTNEVQEAAFTYKDGVFTGEVPFPNGFNFESRYALFIKPEKYAGKVFCGAKIQGGQCTVPQFFFTTSGTAIDLAEHTFLSGDVAPVDGKVDASDMSNIIKNLGKLASDAGETDINSDGITDVTDYSLAFYSLSNNAKDDEVHLTAPEPEPTATPPATPTPTFSLAPTPTATPEPTPTATPKPTATPIPTATPVPTNTPVPTKVPTPTQKVPDYSKIEAMVKNRPQIGCQGGTTQGCPVDDLYNKPVDKGLGWATYYGDEHNPSGNNIVAEVIKNRKGISYDAALKFIDDTYMAKQSDMTPEEAKKTKKVIAYGATRSPSDIWKIKYLFGIDDPKKPKARFIGRIMIMDCAAQSDWTGNLSKLTYGYKGWTDPPLNWIVDLSKNGFIKLPTGYSNLQDNIGEGRPGVVLIDESILDEMIY